MLAAFKHPCKRYLTTAFLGFLLCATAAISQKESVPFVIVLGIAQDAGYPQAACDRDCCRPAWEQPALRRMVSCIAVVDPESGDAWMVDATPDFPEQLYRLEHILPDKPVRLKGIFLTHAHIGHYTGLMHLGREVMGAKALPVYAMPRMRSFLENNGPWSQLLALENVEIRNLSADSTILLNERLSITPVQVPHRDEFSETVGFKIDGPEKSLLYLPDIDKWERWDKDIRAVLKTVDAALLDGTFYQNGEIPGRDMGEIPHPFIAESMARFAGLPKDEKAKVHFIHFNHTNPVLLENSGARQSVERAGFGVCGEGDKFGL